MLRIQALSSNADSAFSSSGGLRGTSLFILIAVVSGVTAIAGLVIFVRCRRHPGEPRTEAVRSTRSVDHSERGMFSNPLHQLVDDSSQSGTQQTFTDKTATGPSGQLIAESSIDSISAGPIELSHVYQSIEDANTSVYLPAVRLPRTGEQSWDSTYWLVAKSRSQEFALVQGLQHTSPDLDLATMPSAGAVQDWLPGSARVANDEDA
jgi:hypothetical protein